MRLPTLKAVFLSDSFRNSDKNKTQAEAADDIRDIITTEVL